MLFAYRPIAVRDSCAVTERFLVVGTIIPHVSKAQKDRELMRPSCQSDAYIVLTMLTLVARKLCVMLIAST